ncbi:MAG: NDP-hexose 4-ketoreductase, partial [Chthoniobacterales bacterium]
VMEETKRVFKPEFLNRLDDIIVFHSLQKSDLDHIVDLEVKKVVDRLKAKDIKLVLEPEAKEFLISKGYDPQYGARPMRRAVERYLEDPVAEEILRGSYQPGQELHVVKEGEKLAFKAKGGAEPPALAAAEQE